MSLLNSPFIQGFFETDALLGMAAISVYVMQNAIACERMYERFLSIWCFCPPAHFYRDAW